MHIKILEIHLTWFDDNEPGPILTLHISFKTSTSWSPSLRADSSSSGLEVWPGFSSRSCISKTFIACSTASGVILLGEGKGRSLWKDSEVHNHKFSMHCFRNNASYLSYWNFYLFCKPDLHKLWYSYTCLGNVLNPFLNIPAWFPSVRTQMRLFNRDSKTFSLLHTLEMYHHVSHSHESNY